MRTKQHTVCHTCRRHKIGCDGLRPGCTQCRLTGRECGGYVQELMVLQHKPSLRPRKDGSSTRRTVTECAFMSSVESSPTKNPVTSRSPKRLSPLQPTYEDSVAVIVQRYIPHYEIPFLSPDSPSRSRICGGWVQALPYVNQNNVGFKRVLLPAARALMLSMSSTGIDGRQHYLDTYGEALRGVRALLDQNSNMIDPAISLASMCLTLSEVTMPTSKYGWIAHLEGVAAMMQSHGPDAFKEGIPHLLFVGFRPLIVLGSLIRCKSTFLMEEKWRDIPFFTQRPSPMQVLLGHAAFMPSLLEKMEERDTDLALLHESFSGALATLRGWENEFSRSETSIYWDVLPCNIDSTIDPQLLPKILFNFMDVSHANSLSHCWAFCIVCLLQLISLEAQLSDRTESKKIDVPKVKREAEVIKLCTLICQALPYLLQVEMSLYGPLSAAFPLRMVFESLDKLELMDSTHMRWAESIKKALLAKGVPML